MEQQENPDMPHALAHLCSHAGEGLICGPCGTLAHESARTTLNNLRDWHEQQSSKEPRYSGAWYEHRRSARHAENFKEANYS